MRHPRPTLLLLLTGLVLSPLLLRSYYHPDWLFVPSPHTHVQPPNAVLTPPQLLLVSAFFPLAKSKHSAEDYTTWLSMFLGSVTTHIYFYTSPDTESMISSLRGDLPITINTSFITPFDIPPLKGLEAHYERTHEIDREKAIHSPELYATWNAKPYFVDDALRNLQREGKTYDYAFWNDAGSFRDHQIYGEWPDSNRVEEIWQTGSAISGTPKEDLIFYPIINIPPPSRGSWLESDGPIDMEFSEGSFFGGSPKAIAWWVRTYYAYHDHYLFEEKYFVGKDQTLINSLFVLFPERIIAVWQYDPKAPNYVGLPGWPLGPCGPSWFYYQFFVAGEADKEAMRNIWKSEVVWPWSWFTDDRCRDTRPLAMTDLLRSNFGPRWVAPKGTVDIEASRRPLR